MLFMSSAFASTIKSPSMVFYARKLFWLFAAIFISLGISDNVYAQNEAPIACWVTEFVPGERSDHWQKGAVQRTRTFSTQKISIDGLSLEKLSEIFEKHVRSSTSPLSSKSQYVSGCTVGGAYEASFGALDYRGDSKEIIWAPSPSELDAARRSATDSQFVYAQCVLTYGPGPVSTPYVDTVLDFATTPIFMAKLIPDHRNTRADAWSKLKDWARANRINDHYSACFSASSQERLKAEYAFAMDHFRAGSQTREIDFSELKLRPGSYLPGAEAKVAEIPKPAPSSPVASGYLSVEDNGNAARAKAQELVLLQAKREEIARKAADAAAAAKSAAKNKQILDKARAERKKRGNRQ